MNNKDRWLHKLSDRLDGYEESAPDGIWDKIEAELDNKETASKVTPMYNYKKWFVVAAAAAILIGVFSYSFYFSTDDLSTSSDTNTYITKQTVVDDELQTEKEVVLANTLSSEGILDDDSKSTSVQSIVKSNDKSSSSVKQSSLIEQPKVIHKNLVAQEVVAIETEKNNEQEVVVKNDSSTSSQAEVKKEVVVEVSTDDFIKREEKKPKRKYDDLYDTGDYSQLLAQTTPKERNSGLSFSVGNGGGFSSTDNNAGSKIVLQQVNIENFPFTQIGDIASKGMVLKNGIPYMKEKVKTHKFKHKQPITFGLNYRHNLTNTISLETGLFYTYLSSDITEIATNRVMKQKFHYLGIPLNVNWSFLQNKRFSLYTTAGLSVELCVAGSVDGKSERAKPVQFSFQGGLGGQVNLSRNVGFYIEPGVSYYIKDGSDFETIRKDKPFNFNLNTGLRLTF